MGFDNHSSTESDDDSNVRHDRFKSERFQKESSESSRRREEKFSRPSDLYHGSTRYRERSPRGSHRYREVISSSSSSSRNKSKYEIRNDHDRKDRSKHSYSRSSKSDRNDSKHSSSSVDKGDSGSKTKKNLSSLLKSFDKQVESKRNTSEDHSNQPSKEMGPALPLHLKEKTEPSSDSDQEKKTEEGSAFLDRPTMGSNAQSIDLKSENTSRSLEVELLSQKNTPMVKEHKDDVYFAEGPALPPHLHNSVEDDNISCTDHQETSNISSPPENLANSETTRDTCTLSLPPKSETETYGPALPPKIESSAYGPALPPKTESSTFGPTLPPELKNNGDQIIPLEVGEEQNEESDDDEDIVGPLPEGKMTMTQYQLDIRAANIKRQLEEEVSSLC